MTTHALDPSGLRQVLDAGRALVAQLELDAVLEQLLRTACEVTGARYAAMWTAASVLTVAGTLVLIALTALAIGHALHRLLDDEDGDLPHAV